jgi:hypothetical protein
MHHLIERTARGCPRGRRTTWKERAMWVVMYGVGVRAAISHGSADRDPASFGPTWDPLAASRPKAVVY